MPISPEFAHLYRGTKWKERRDEILKRDKNRCKKCGAKKDRMIQRRIVRRKGEPTRMWWRYVNRGKPGRNAWRDEKGDRDSPARTFTREYVVAVQLGVAHLDHNPENDADSNLAALCRRCHIVHDADQHKRNAALTRSDRKDRERPLLRIIEGAT